MLICLDYKNVKGNWQKEWSNLGPNTKVITRESIQTCSDLTSAQLILVHASLLDDFQHEFPALKNDLLNRFQGCIGIVSGSSQKHEVKDGGRVCAIQTLFPLDLSDLKLKVDRLTEDLSKALTIFDSRQREIALTKAWDSFDQEERTLEVLSVLAILSQGYLAVHAEEINGKWGPVKIVSALEQMGWPEVMADENVQQLIRKDLSSRRDAVAKSSWWLEVFEIEGDLGSQVESLKKRIREEWNEENTVKLPEEIIAFLRSLASGSLSDPGIVAAAYSKIADKLGGKPCQP